MHSLPSTLAGRTPVPFGGRIGVCSGCARLFLMTPEQAEHSHLPMLCQDCYLKQERLREWD